MPNTDKLPNDKFLFTPGPLTTSRTVKEAMLTDLGSRDSAFITAVAEIRSELLKLSGVDADEYAAIPMQGSGTFGIESVLTTAIPRDGKLLVAANGAYGTRIVQVARVLGIETEVIATPEAKRIDPAQIERALASDSRITHVAVVHCETTTGLINPIEVIGSIVRKAGRALIVDAMSSFGAVPVALGDIGVDYLISSANKCIEGVPGFSFVIARKKLLGECEGRARSVSLDLFAQWRGLEQTKQFRFTPPTHSLLAFRQALRELAEEGGVAGRAARYSENHRTLMTGMKRIGFTPYLPDEDQGYIITSYRYPTHPKFVFEGFYKLLSDKGFVIYPGKVTNADCFRIGTIGRLYPHDITALIGAIESVLSHMGVTFGG